jgi:hypothetical protein
MNKQIVEFFEENDVIRFRCIGYLDITPEMIRCGEPTIDHYHIRKIGTLWDKKERKYVERTMRCVCPPSLIGKVETEEVPNQNFRVLWDRHADELGVPRGTVIH